MATVRVLPSVVDYLRRVPHGIVDVDHEEADAYFVHVYEVVDGHTATFNWFTVDKVTGIAEADFP